MPTLLVKNADVLVTMDAARRELRGAGLYAVDGFVRQVGATRSCPRPPTWSSTSRARSCCPASSTPTTT